MSAAAESPPVIEFRNVSYTINGKTILDKLNLVVRNGETLVLLGRSGSGKTTALKLINRLREPSAGEVIVSEKPTICWDPTLLRRRIGYVIQETGLFPHFTVERNIALVPHLENWPKERVRTRVREALQIVGLGDGEFETRYPHELSGGQRQRVGVARALAADPPILLMDEPFGALDPLTRAELQSQFQEIQRKLAKTIVFVTHDLREALLLGTRIALLEGGKLDGVYTPEEFANAREPVAAAYRATLRTGESELNKLERH
jgi:osmoprotectant transport system ATP-binding protein